MGLADRLFFGTANWNNIAGFVLRNAASESAPSTYNIRRGYQKILIATWIWAAMITLMLYTNNLTARLAKPKLPTPIGSFEELLRQGEVPWVIEEALVECYGSTGEVFKGDSFKTGVNFRLLPSVQYLHRGEKA